MLEALIDIEDWVKLIGGMGLGATLSLLLLWRMFQDKDKSDIRLTALEEFVHNQLLDLIKNESTLTQRCIEVIQENTKINDQCLRALENYEALLKDKHTMQQQLLAELAELRRSRQ